MATANPDDKRWTLLRSRLVFDHHWYKVRQDEVRLPNGEIIDDYFVSVRPDVALVLPITVDREVIFVHQYRHGAGEVLLELPAGTFDPQQEAAETAALRELQEETGYSAEALIHLATLYDNPVKETNRIHMFLAYPVQYQGEQALDVTEDIDLVKLPVDQINTKILQGEIAVSGTIAALHLGLTYFAQVF
ncbi:MAG: NUDIX hydrolase [Cyanobacteria bacterium P01_A01_bin.123]